MNSTAILRPIKNPPTKTSAMKELLSQYAAYNYWANKLLLDLINSLPEEKQQQQLTSSFPTFFATLLHMWDAEAAWLQRIKMHERVVIPSENFKGDLSELSRQLLLHNQQWIDWVSNASDAALEHVFQYYNSRKEYFKQPVWQVILHANNHGTYHRGQLVTMLRQAGVEKLPQIDYIVFSRLKKAPQ
jgi:uncharacterized damage-inducible protein DinB